jgi:hypothetical protein
LTLLPRDIDVISVNLDIEIVFVVTVLLVNGCKLLGCFTMLLVFIPVAIIVNNGLVFNNNLLGDITGIITVLLVNGCKLLGCFTMLLVFIPVAIIVNNGLVFNNNLLGDITGIITVLLVNGCALFIDMSALTGDVTNVAILVASVMQVLQPVQVY